MIVEVDLDYGPRVVEPETLTAFSVAAATDDAALVGSAMGPAGHAAEKPGHVWVSADWIRASVGGTVGPDWADGFAAMLEYAESKDWMNASGSHILAHIEAV